MKTLAWISAGLPFELVEVIDEWKEESTMHKYKIPVALAVRRNGSLCCLWNYHNTYYLMAFLNNNVMWEI